MLTNVDLHKPTFWPNPETLTLKNQITLKLKQPNFWRKNWPFKEQRVLVTTQWKLNTELDNIWLDKELKRWKLPVRGSGGSRWGRGRCGRAPRQVPRTPWSPRAVRRWDVCSVVPVNVDIPPPWQLTVFK